MRHSQDIAVAPILAVSLLMLVAASPVSAVPITVTFPGVITRQSPASSSDFANDFVDRFPLGTPFTFSYTLDPDAASFFGNAQSCVTFPPHEGSICQYEGDPPSAFTASILIGERVLSDSPDLGPTGRVHVDIGGDISGQDRWILTFGPADPDIAVIRIVFAGPEGRLDSGDFFVNTSEDGWSVVGVRVSSVLIPGLGTRAAVFGTIIPEPTSAALLLIGLAGLLLGRLALSRSLTS